MYEVGKKGFIFGMWIYLCTNQTLGLIHVNSSVCLSVHLFIIKDGLLLLGVQVGGKLLFLSKQNSFRKGLMYIYMFLLFTCIH